jgi:cystathionine beta-synthase
MSATQISAPPRPGVLGLIGDTPVVEITRFDTGPCRLFVKLESQNPGGSIKDRIALSMIETAERDGRLKPRATIIEATAGNTGLGLALVAARKGYKLILVVPDKMAREKILNLRALGADVRITRSDVGKGHPEYYQDLAQEITAGLDNAFFVNQFGNEANPLAHETTTAPEIWRQMEGQVDAVVCGVGSGGTLTGLGRFFRRVSPETEMVLADPEGSVLAHYVRTGELVEAGSWAVEGIGEDFVPPVADMSLVKSAYTIPDRESFETARDLLVLEGILAGSSSGTLVSAALRYCRDQTMPKRVITFICDSGNKYLSKMFNDFWLLEQGFTDRPLYGDVRDLVTRRYDRGGTISVGPDDTLRTAYSRMRAADVSQLPVLEDGKLVGLVDESDLLRDISGHGGPKAFQRSVRDAMTGSLQTLDSHSPIDALFPIFAADRVAIITENDRFIGLVTRVDMINHFRLGQ